MQPQKVDFDQYAADYDTKLSDDLILLPKLRLGKATKIKRLCQHKK